MKSTEIRPLSVLYVAHALPWNEYTGATICLNNYITQGRKVGYKITLLVPEQAYINIEHNPYEDVNIHKFEGVSNWGVSAFDSSLLSLERCNIELKIGKFDIVHIINWVNFNPNIFYELSKFDAPIVRHVMGFEDYCPYQAPIEFDSKTHTACDVPINRASCVECLNENLTISFPACSITLRDLENQIRKIKEANTKTNQLLYGRNKFVYELYEKYIDYTIFPSIGFKGYYYAERGVTMRDKVIPHGIPKFPAFNSDSSIKIKIAYVGGNKISKGWDIVQEFLLEHESEYSGLLEIDCYCDSIPVDYFNKFPNTLNYMGVYSHDHFVNKLGGYDILLAPSHFETYGIMVREAASLGVVPVVLDTLGLMHDFKDRLNCVILAVPYVNSLDSALKEFSCNRLILEELKESTRKSNFFTIEEEYAQLADIYHQLLNEKIK